MSNFNLQNSYPCPLCGHKDLTALTLMEAFGCSCCQHLFTADIPQQTLTLADSISPVIWIWQEKKWRRFQPGFIKVGGIYSALALIYLLLPPGIIALATYIFPPLPGSPLSWFPVVWIGLTFIAHLTTLAGLLLQTYQFPLTLPLIRLRFSLRRLFPGQSFT